MIDLNNLEEIKRLDPKNVYGSTDLVLEQCSQIWNESKPVFFPTEFSDIKNVVFCGMGGSGLGAQVVYHLFKEKLTVPFYINNDYSLPGFADENTLVILSSYSGGTEETLSCLGQARAKKCKITGITTGGKLGGIFDTAKTRYIKINPTNNPAGQPRLGTGYSVFGLISILSKLNILNIKDEEVTTAIDDAKSNKETAKGMALKLSRELMDSIPLVFSSGFLTGNAHIIRNQMNETAKTFSSYSPIPELNHHLMEGLKNPKNKNIKVLFLYSKLYPGIIKKRIELTKDVVSQNGLPYLEYEAVGESEISQSLNTLSFGGFLTLYLALLYGLDPSLIPWVDYFKENLHK